MQIHGLQETHLILDGAAPLLLPRLVAAPGRASARDEVLLSNAPVDGHLKRLGQVELALQEFGARRAHPPRARSHGKGHRQDDEEDGLMPFGDTKPVSGCGKDHARARTVLTTAASTLLVIAVSMVIVRFDRRHLAPIAAQSKEPEQHECDRGDGKTGLRPSPAAPQLVLH